jgi:hypothetical protein
LTGRAYSVDFITHRGPHRSSVIVHPSLTAGAYSLEFIANAGKAMVMSPFELHEPLVQNQFGLVTVWLHSGHTNVGQVGISK